MLKSHLKVLKWTVLSAVLVSLFLMFAIAFDGLMDDVQSSDVAVILGSKIEMSGRPSARLAARLDKGIALYRTGITHTIIVSGGTGIEGFSEAKVMRDYLVQMGVPPAHIILDETGNNTEETAKHCAVIMKNNGFKSIIIVTQYFHVSRTRMALKNQNIKTIHSAHAYYFEYRDIYSLVREAVAIPVYWMRK